MSISTDRIKAVRRLKTHCEFIFDFEWDDRRDRETAFKRMLPGIVFRFPGVIALASKLKSVIVSDFNGDEDALAPIAELKELRQVGIVDSEISGKSVSFVSQLPSLEYLSLAGSTVSDGDLLASTLPESLRTLVVSGSKVSEEGVFKLRDTLGNCEVIFDKDWTYTD